MPENKKDMMRYEEMLDELASEYPGVKREAHSLKKALMEDMPSDEEFPMMDEDEDEDMIPPQIPINEEDEEDEDDIPFFA